MLSFEELDLLTWGELGRVDELQWYISIITCCLWWWQPVLHYIGCSLCNIELTYNLCHTFSDEEACNTDFSLSLQSVCLCVCHSSRNRDYASVWTRVWLVVSRHTNVCSSCWTGL